MVFDPDHPETAMHHRTDHGHPAHDDTTHARDETRECGHRGHRHGPPLGLVLVVLAALRAAGRRHHDTRRHHGQGHCPHHDHLGDADATASAEA